MLASCASPTSALRSGIDANYQLQRVSHNLPYTSRSPGISFYQSVLSRTLGSHCTMFPHDSLYAQLIVAQCGQPLGIFRAMARVYLEVDAANLGYPILWKKDEILFKDLPDHCNLF